MPLGPHDEDNGHLPKLNKGLLRCFPSCASGLSREICKWTLRAYARPMVLVAGSVRTNFTEITLQDFKQDVFENVKGLPRTQQYVEQQPLFMGSLALF